MYRVVLALCFSLCLVKPVAAQTCMAFEDSVYYNTTCGFSVSAYYFPVYSSSCNVTWELYDDDMSSSCGLRAEARCEAALACSSSPAPDSTDTDSTNPAELLVNIDCACSGYFGINGEVRAWHYSKPYMYCLCGGKTCASPEYREKTICD